MIKSFFFSKKWRLWAWGGFSFIIGSLLAQTYIDVKINGPSIKIEHSIEKARTVLGYEPKYDIFKTIDDGVKIITN